MIICFFGKKNYYHDQYFDFDPSVFLGKNDFLSQSKHFWSRYYHNISLWLFFGITIGKVKFKGQKKLWKRSETGPKIEKNEKNLEKMGKKNKKNDPRVQPSDEKW